MPSQNVQQTLASEIENNEAEINKEQANINRASSLKQEILDKWLYL